MKWYLLVIAIIVAPFWADAQVIDSVEAARLGKLARIKANKDIQMRVDREINEHRLLMLGRNFMNLPTDIEAQRIQKGRYSRYTQLDTFILGTYRTSHQGVFYRNRNKIKPKQNLTVLGWHPYWETEAYKTYNYQLLTHLSFYAYEINPFTGSYKNFRAIYELEQTDLVSTAHLDSCKVLLTVSCSGAQDNDIFFSGPELIRENLIDSIKSIVLRTGIDGIEINFEEIPSLHKAAFLDFVEELSFTLREADNRMTVSMVLPLKDRENIYDFKSLKPWVDFFVINGFNTHLNPAYLKEGGLAPLLDKDAAVRGSVLSYKQVASLDSILRSPYLINSITLLHDNLYAKKLRDSLNQQIRKVYRNLEYDDFEITSILNTLQVAKTRTGKPLYELPAIQQLLKKTECEAVLTKQYQAKEKGVNYFLFRPQEDTLNLTEYELFRNATSVLSVVDSQTVDIASAVDVYRDKIGVEEQGSLVLGLPYYGAVWYRSDEGKRQFKGYMSYTSILDIVSSNTSNVYYDKSIHVMIASLRDTIGGVYSIYFDNSTTLGNKYDYVINSGLGGVGIWALGLDYGRRDLWGVLERHFAMATVWDVEKLAYKRPVVAKVNKISYTLTYMFKYYGKLITATLFFITIFVLLGFCFSILDWKVRDVLFYSGAFRVFYLVLFTIFFIVLGNRLGWFESSVVSLALGLLLGGGLTWGASKLMHKKQERIP